MNPINSLLSLVGLKITRTRTVLPVALARRYDSDLARVRREATAFQVFRQPVYELGVHPASHVDFECSFAAAQIAARRPERILDIGSHRHFVLGLLAHHRVTTLDVRERRPASDNETVLTCDAKTIGVPSGSFDLVLSLCSLEHFGLGRYGDEIDSQGDEKAVRQMTRILRPGGAIVFSTTVTRACPAIAFNAHRIYNLTLIRSMLAGPTSGARPGLVIDREEFFSTSLGRSCTHAEVTRRTAAWDVYCGCYVKP